MSRGSSPPRVDPEYQEAAPWANNDGMVKFIEFPVRVKAMSRRAFHLYWQRHHSPHVMNVTPFSQYMRKYSTGHVYDGNVPGLPPTYRQSLRFEGASEVWIDGLSELGSWLGHPLYTELIQPDERRFLRQDGTGEFMIGKEERVYVPDSDMRESGMTKLYLLMKKRVGMDHHEFHRALSAYGRPAADQPAIRSLIRKCVITHRILEPWPEGLSLADIDAVVELWFDRWSDGAALFALPAYRTMVAPVEQSSDDIRALLAKVQVVHDELSFQPTTTQPFGFSWDD